MQIGAQHSKLRKNQISSTLTTLIECLNKFCLLLRLIIQANAFYQAKSYNLVLMIDESDHARKWRKRSTIVYTSYNRYYSFVLILRERTSRKYYYINNVLYMHYTWSTSYIFDEKHSCVYSIHVLAICYYLKIGNDLCVLH